MFKRVRKTVVILAFAVALAVFMLGTAIVAGHNPTAHADGLGGAQVEVFCKADQAMLSPNNVTYMQVDGENQDGNWVTWSGNTTWQGSPASDGEAPAYTYIVTTNWWWVGTVTVTFQDGWGDTWQESVPIDPSTYGGTVVWYC